jgi:hypothetical protein
MMRAGRKELSTRALVSVGIVVMGVMALVSGTSATAAAPPAPAWGLTVAGVPSVLPLGVGRHGRFDVVVENVGGLGSEAGAVVRDVLPTGLTATNVAGAECTGLGTSEVECPLPEPVASGGFAFLAVEFEETGALTAGQSLPNVVHVSGGGGQEASSEDSIRVLRAGEKGSGPAGITHFAISATGLAGEAVSQAAGHPNFLTTSVLFNSMFTEILHNPTKPVEGVKDLVFYLPLGMLGNPTVAQQCPAAVVETQPELTGCPSGSQVGEVMPLILSTVGTQHGIYNIAPEKGYAAEFAFASNGFTFVTYASVVRRDHTYMVRVSVPGVPVGSALIGVVATFFGDVKEHDLNNGGELLIDRGAFLTSPSDCGEGPEAREGTVAVDTWEHPDATLPITATSTAFPVLEHCESLRFSADLGITPETTQADEPSSYEVGLEVPQAPNDFSGLGTPPVKKASVTLPAGATVSPSSANGLVACAASGPHGIDIEGPESEEVAEDGLERPAHGNCPLASQIATVRASTPLLQEELTGRVFLATPACGGEGQPGCTPEDAEDGKLVGLYLELEGPNSGVVVKLAGHATVTRGSGQVTASFEELPQFPFSKFVVTTKRGAHAPLANSQTCGLSKSTATLTPWSPGTPEATVSDGGFEVDWNGSGQKCPASAPFAPTFTAGTTSPTAATTSPFTLTFKREDREQNISTVSNTLPEGLLADLSKVTRCPEPLASEASLTACPAASQIGTTTAAVGSGSDPYYVTGKVFFTGPYNGAPFGLSVVVPAVAGPFNLGNVLVRVKLTVDPHTAQASAVSDPLPQELDGVPLRMRLLNVTLTDGDFVLNPTGCAKTSIVGTVTSTAGATAAVSSPFAAVGCNRLPFDPVLSASTEAKATKANGTGVTIKIAYPSSGQANISKVVIGFPKQLPVRLETLQQACRAVIFEANPAACPANSVVGTATAHTPILAQPLTGPVYLVSYGSAKFPDAVLVVQGEGITIDVDGQSFVSQNGALTVTFSSVPDAPISSFETVLPAKPFSQFTSVKTSGKAQGSQCGQNLVAPVSMVAHNGATLNKNVKVIIAGCRPSVSIGKTRGTSHGLSVTVKTTAQGRLRISGPGLKTLTRRNVSAGTHTLAVKLTSAGVAAAHAHKKTELTVGLVAGGQKATKHKKVAL